MGSIGAKAATPDVASAMPAPTRSTAAPNATMPTAPAASAGPRAAAPSARAATEATIPSIASAAAGPADATWMAAVASSRMPAAASATPAPTRSTAAPNLSMLVADAPAAVPAAVSPPAMADRPPAAIVESDEMAPSVPDRDFTAPATADAAFMSTNPTASARTAGAAFAALSLSHFAASDTPWIIGWTLSSADLNASAAPAASLAPGSIPSSAPARLPIAPNASATAPPRSDRSSESAWIAPLSWHLERKSATESPMPSITSPAEAMPSVRGFLNASSIFEPAVTADASRLPIAPSMVAVEVAASLATSVMPSCMIAWLNSSAEI